MQSDRFARKIVQFLMLSFAARSRRLMRPVGLRGAGCRFECGTGFTERLVSEWFGVRCGRFAKLNPGRRERATCA
jgi:hypothetical protein